MKIIQLEVTYTEREVQGPLVASVGMKINRASQVVELMAWARFFPVEHVWVILMDDDRKVIGISEVAKGVDRKADFDVREIIRVCLLVRECSKFMMVHNHPSPAAATPSPEDINATHRVKKAAELLGLKLVDHIVISERGWENILTPKTLLTC